MTRLAEVWRDLTETEQNTAAVAMREALGPAGVDLIVAVAKHARGEPDPDRPECPDCKQPIVGRPYARVVDLHGSRRPLWLCARCYAARLLGEETAGEEP